MPENLTPRRRKAVQELLTSGSVTAAAQAAGVSRETLYKWLKRDDFRRALTEAEGEALESLSRSLVVLGSKATQTLQDAMGSDQPLWARIRAADIVLLRLLQLRELASLENRILELERKDDETPS
jgi:transposase-like protein